MASVASGGTADRIAARILFKVLRAGSGTPARYSSTFFGAPLPFAAELRSPDFTFFMRAMLQELPLQVHAPDRRAAVRHEKCHIVFRHTFTCPYSRNTGCAVKRRWSTAGVYPPGNWFAPPGSNQSSSGGNETAEASGAESR